MECFFLCLPLIEDRFLKDFLYRVAGEPNVAYLMAKLADFWELIPHSPCKSYVEKYIYFYLTAPSLDEDSQVALEKRQEYHRYRNSRAYQEESRAYRIRLWEFRSKQTTL